MIINYVHTLGSLSILAFMLVGIYFLFAVLTTVLFLSVVGPMVFFIMWSLYEDLFGDYYDDE